MVSPKELKKGEDVKEEISTGILSWDQPKEPEKATDFDWGTTTTDFRVKTDDFELKWSDDEGEKSDSSEDGLKMKIGGNDKEEEEVIEEDEEDAEEKVDIMAQQLKFVACLKILMEELSTLATGFEVDGKFVLMFSCN